mmetsp:Transcript_9785/g.19225  ORF Transcript_9785/g.19225 Transcript_9785/m.19225 type:complete len:82 (+) Transcript_9785:273-518(+)
MSSAYFSSISISPDPSSEGSSCDLEKKEIWVLPHRSVPAGVPLGRVPRIHCRYSFAYFGLVFASDGDGSQGGSSRAYLQRL